MIAFIKSLISKRLFSNQPVIDSSVRFFDGAGSGFVRNLPFDYTKAVAQFNSWVYSASRIVAYELAKQPLRLFIRTRDGTKLYRSRSIGRLRKDYLCGRGPSRPSAYVMRKTADFNDDFEEVTEPHPAIEVLAEANDFENGFGQTALRFIYLQLTGNSYLHPVFNRMLGIPEEVWLMPSQWVTILPDKEEFIRGYNFGAEFNNQRFFEPDEIIHFKLPNPENVFYGKGPLEAIFSAWGLHLDKRQMDLANFQNRGRPDWIIAIKGANQDAVDRFERKVENKFRGPRKAGRMLALANDVETKQLSFPPDIIGDADRILDEISSAFGVPRAMLTGNVNVPGGGPEMSDVTFLRGTILPYLRMDEERLNEKWLPLFGIEDDAFLAYDNPVPEDRQFELTRTIQLTAAGLTTRNEGRAELGLEPNDSENADELLIGAQPIDQVAQVQAGGFGGLFATAGLPGMGQTERAQQNRAAPPSAEQIAEIVSDAVRVGVQREMRRALKKAAKIDSPDISKPPARMADETLQECLDRAIPVLIAEGKPRAQAAAIAHSLCEKSTETVTEKEATKWLSQRAVMAGLVDVESLCRCEQATQSSKPKQSDSADGEHAAIELLFEPDIVKQDAETDIREDEPERPGDQMRRILQDILDSMKEEILGVISARERTKILENIDFEDIDAIIAEHRSRIFEDIAAPLERILTAGAGEGLTRIDLDPSIFSVTDPNVRRKLDGFRERLAGNVTDNTITRLRASLGEGVSLGETGSQLADRVEGTGLFDRNRSEIIARTESARAFIEGQLEGWKQTDVVAGKKWLLAPNACPWCVAAAKAFNAQTRTLDTSVQSVIGSNALSAVFPGGKTRILNLDYAPVLGGGYLHPNCRCTIVPVLVGE